MCGIYGYKLSQGDLFEKHEFTFHSLMKFSDERGKEASGVACISNHHHILTIRSPLGAKALLNSKEYKSFLIQVNQLSTHTVLGHSRLATNGGQLEQSNNHPIISDDKNFICIHNGIIVVNKK